MNSISCVQGKIVIEGFLDLIGKKVKLTQRRYGISISKCPNIKDYGCIYMTEEILNKPVVRKFLESNDVFESFFIQDETGAYIQSPK